MKKLNLALAVLGTLAGTASAQTSISVYGIVDAGIVYESKSVANVANTLAGVPLDTSVLKLSSGVQSGSRVGFRGTEDLGGGLVAKFVLETGIAIDTGGFNQGGLAFGRQAYVGLGGNWGAVTLGRQYTPHYLALAEADPFGTGLAGNAQNLVTSVTRMNNTIKYTAPVWSGFVGELSYGFGEVADNNTANRQYGAAIGYNNGPIVVKLAHHSADNATGTDHSRTTLLMGKYDFGMAAASLAFNNTQGIAGIDSRDYLVGVSVPLGAGTVLLSYISKDDRSARNGDADQWAIGYTHAISKRTNFYTSFARISNKNGANFTVGNAIDPGIGEQAFNIGVRHSF